MSTNLVLGQLESLLLTCLIKSAAPIAGPVAKFVSADCDAHGGCKCLENLHRKDGFLTSIYDFISSRVAADCVDNSVDCSSVAIWGDLRFSGTSCAYDFVSRTSPRAPGSRV